MDPRYDHSKYEEEIYGKWEKSGAFTPTPDKKKPSFTIIMPPPNANDPLHIGHARFIAIQDILIRYHRMKGDVTLWLPGADHAGIETQYVFEKKLANEGKSRFDFNRDTLYKMIWDYVQKNTGTMQSQLKKLGASCDWSRFKFTLDPDVVKIVHKTFKNLHEDKLVYRGKRLVNYCTFCGTGYSNLEVNHVERVDPLYYIKYGPFVLATVRPETKFGDTAIAVNPKDKRYKKWVGKEVDVEGLIGKFKIKVIADESVDPEFGTGVLKITPAHDFNDFEVGERHGLEVKQVIEVTGKLNSLAGKYEGLFVKEARRKVVEDLKEKGYIEKVDEKYKHSVGVCYRCKNTIEPMLMEQWFIKVAPLAKKALLAIKDGSVKFAAKKYEKVAIHWLKNLRDWNISRQIVWGIRILAWKCNECSEWTITEGAAPGKCLSCGHKNLTQDPDTFDTWFSSGQWPYATLKTTKEGDFGYFYPTSAMETAYEILPFWVIRMIMLGLYSTEEVPFKDVLIHGLVRDKEGQKISKSKGNVINPIEMVEKYGSDALRMGIVWGTAVDTDIALNEDAIRGQRNFANKIWNVSRFVRGNFSPGESKKGKQNKDDVWILSELEKITKEITSDLDNYRLNEAAEKIYDFVWHKFADVYIERVKDRKDEAEPTLVEVLSTSLRLLHPFMPFVTEKVWGLMGNKDLLISSNWPVR